MSSGFEWSQGQGPKEEAGPGPVHLPCSASPEGPLPNLPLNILPSETIPNVTGSGKSAHRVHRASGFPPQQEQERAPGSRQGSGSCRPGGTMFCLSHDMP